MAMQMAMQWQVRKIQFVKNLNKFNNNQIDAYLNRCIGIHRGNCNGLNSK